MIEQSYEIARVLGSPYCFLTIIFSLPCVKTVEGDEEGDRRLQLPILEQVNAETVSKKNEPPTIEMVTDERQRDRSSLAVKVTEEYVMLSCMAMGIQQMNALHFWELLYPAKFRYSRTLSKTTVSETTIQCYLRKSIFRIIPKRPDLDITQLIKAKQEASAFYVNLQASL